MELRNLRDVDSEELESSVQESTVLKREGLVGDVGEQVITANEVTFRPGERTKMHKHDYGQLLYVTGGTGVVATREEEREVSEGDLIFFRPGEEHWHGTAPEATSDFSHLTVVLRDAVGEGTTAVE